jgi:hypothetical protein
MKISLIHPSRSRPEKAKETYEYWMSKSSGFNEIEHILSLDFNDPRETEYEVFGPYSRITIDHNNSVVEATNQAAKIATGDILIYLSDDFKCPDNWDEKIRSLFAFATMQPKNMPALLKVDDCLQQFNVCVLTIPIMNRELYEKLGYFWHPAYKSMFVDEDLFWTCTNNNWMMYAPELQFPHEHCSIGKAERDETYIRSEANWNQGKEVFEKRRLEGFPLCN